ncbi:BACON domain-containing carbohydrate-binding protein [uncultured Alistipes sp.]|jgi:hypothetical protein|uniref:BACON domain-containing protein n=1 Tax=uncultured Alistipes sp. TaxID=538949 RepID=UPI0025F97225|nr:BACON domain-containing carbohydrate-binding protein [uncultured Alistipes sp.]
MKAFLKIISIVSILLTLVALGGCVDEKGNGFPEGEATLTIDLGPAYVSGSSTRALSEAEESRIKTLDLVAFKWNGLLSRYEFSYYSYARFSRTDNNKYNARATVEVDEHNHQLFILIANARDQVRALAAGTEFEAAQESLVFTNEDPWDATSGNFDHIPMYMHSIAPMLIEDANQHYSLSGRLIRMLARIDVSVRSTVTNFQLAEAYVFNRMDRGHIAYKSGDATYWDPTAEKALKSYVPVDAERKFTHTTPYVAVGGKFERALYTFEAEGKDNADFREATAIIIGGYYDYPTNQSDVTYYRIDIPKLVNGTPDTDQLGDILRNHKYDMQIGKIKGEGAPTPEEAFYGRVKIDADIVIWNLADLEAKFDMTHWLKVSQAAYHMMPDGTNRYNGSVNQSLDISSNYDGGWYAELYPADATDWITFYHEDGFTPLSFPLRVTGSHEDPDYNLKNIKFTVAPGDGWAHAVIKVRCGGPDGKLAKYVDIYRADFTSGEMFDWTQTGVDDGSTPVNIYRLGVSRAGYTLSRDKHEEVKIVVSTDYDDGYTVKADESWITVTSPATVSQQGTTTVTYDVEQNMTYAVRRGKIRIRAGTIEKVINVIQSNEALTDGELETFPWENPVFDDGGGTNIGGPYTLNTSVTGCRYDKDAKTGMSIDITADGRGDADKAAWVATANVPWIDITSGTGLADAGGVTSQLVYNVEPTTVNRNAVITVTLGTDRKKIEKQIKVTQYPEAGVTLENAVSSYRVSSATESVNHKIKITASHAGASWLAICSDPSMIHMRQSAGKGTTAGDEFAVFSLLPEAEGGSYTITIYSPTGEFDTITVPFDAVL